MKVKFLAYNIYGIGGTVRTTVNTANYLAERGMDVEIISVRRTQQIPALGVADAVKCTSLIDMMDTPDPRGLRYLGKNAKRLVMRSRSRLIHRDEDLYKNFSLLTDVLLVRALRSLRDCVLVTTFPSLNLLATKWTDASVVTVGQEHKEFDLHSPKLRREIESSYGHLDAVTCITRAAAERYTRLLRGAATVVAYMPNGTPVPDGLACERGGRTVVAAGRISPEKGFDHLIEAFAHVVEQHPDWKLKIFGNGDTESLRQIVFARGLHNHVFLLPPTTDLATELQQADVYALSSRHESFGMVLIEAMAHGLPCVSTDCEGPRQLIRDGENGLLVPRGDSQQFGQRLCALIRDAALRDRIGTAARASVQEYDLRNVGARWGQFLDFLWSRRAFRHSTRAASQAAIRGCAGDAPPAVRVWDEQALEPRG
jgi:glycosyltransferase involved in cell wall biosynthesis